MNIDSKDDQTKEALRRLKRLYDDMHWRVAMMHQTLDSNVFTKKPGERDNLDTIATSLTRSFIERCDEDHAKLLDLEAKMTNQNYGVKSVKSQKRRFLRIKDTRENRAFLSEREIDPKEIIVKYRNDYILVHYKNVDTMKNHS